MTMMLAEPAVGMAWVAPAVEAYRAGRSVALLFDYDGTLTPIVRHPSLARLPETNRTRLAALAALPDTAVGVISGRALAEVREFVGLEGLYYAGSGGLELDLRGERIDYPGAGEFRCLAARVIDTLAPVLTRFTGTWVERKPVALALHHRGLKPAASVRFRAEVAALLARHPGVSHREVSESIEVTPAGGWDKGTAVERVLDRLGPDVFPVFAGDAANDAEAMAVVALTGGVAVGVGPDAPPTATHRVGSSAEIAAGLDRLVRALPAARGLSLPSPRPESGVVFEEPAVSRPADDPATLAPGPGSDTSDHPRGPGILVADPDPAFRAEFAAALRAAGWRVWTTGDTGDAVRLARRHAEVVRAAVVGLQFPGLQATRLLAELEAFDPDLVRCAVSAEVSAYAAAAFRRLSDTTLFTVPFDYSAASATLRWLIGDDDDPIPPEERMPHSVCPSPSA